MNPRPVIVGSARGVTRWRSRNPTPWRDIIAIHCRADLAKLQGTDGPLELHIEHGAAPLLDAFGDQLHALVDIANRRGGRP